MVTYQTALYKVKYLDEQFGWDYDVLLFQSGVYEEPWKAMMEFDFHEPTHPNWFVTVREIMNGEIIDEELFDISVIPYPY